MDEENEQGAITAGVSSPVGRTDEQYGGDKEEENDPWPCATNMMSAPVLPRCEHAPVLPLMMSMPWCYHDESMPCPGATTDDEHALGAITDDESRPPCDHYENALVLP
eukprot:gene32209-16761_t